MRIWSLHPQYLDAKGLVALWRETLLAKHVLAGRTKGYRSHPQLLRFKRMPEPLHAIDRYLGVVHDEAVARGYRFDKAKIDPVPGPVGMRVTTGQMAFETAHLLRKLQQRDMARWETLRAVDRLAPHPLFRVVEGPVADWEVV